MEFLLGNIATDSSSSVDADTYLYDADGELRFNESVSGLLELTYSQAAWLEILSAVAANLSTYQQLKIIIRFNCLILIMH